MVTVTQALGDTVTLDIGSRLVRIETLDLVKLGVQAPENTRFRSFSVSRKSSLGSFETTATIQKFRSTLWILV